MATLLNSVGPNIVKYRQLAGWIQEELLTKLHLAGCIITRQTLANIEIGRAPVHDYHLCFLAKVFGIRTEDLFPEHLRDGRKMKSLHNQFAVRRLRRSRYKD